MPNRPREATHRIKILLTCFGATLLKEYLGERPTQVAVDNVEFGRRQPRPQWKVVRYGQRIFTRGLPAPRDNTLRSLSSLDHKFAQISLCAHSLGRACPFRILTR